MSSEGSVAVVGVAVAPLALLAAPVVVVAGVAIGTAALATLLVSTTNELLAWEQKSRQQFDRIYQESVRALRAGRPGVNRDALRAMAHLEVAWRSFQNSPHRALLEGLQPQVIPQLAAERLELQRMWMEGRWQEAHARARALSRKLRQTMREIRRGLPALQAEALAGIAHQALRELGYTVTIRRRESEWRLQAIRGPYQMVLLIPPGRSLRFDMAGFEGAACLAELQRFQRTLEGYGLRLDIRRRVHGRREGGSLIAGSSRSPEEIRRLAVATDVVQKIPD